MKWFQTDSDAPNDPKLKATIRRFGQAGAGALFLLWCYVANHGKGEPGLAVAADGSPLPPEEAAEETLFDTVDQFREFIGFLAEKKHVDPDLWTGKGIVFLPAMFTRAVGYARGKGRAGSIYATPADVVKAVLTGEKPPAPPAPENPGKPPAGKRGPGRPRKTPAVPGNPLTVQDKQDNTNKQIPPDGGSGPAAHPAPGFLPELAPAKPGDLMQLWNRCRTKGPQVESLTPQRMEIYHRALKAKPDLAEWELVITWLDGQAWANAPGTGDHPNWRATLDWLAKPGKLQQWLEKAKADKAGGGGNGGGNGNGRVKPTAGKYSDLKDDGGDDAAAAQ